MDIAEIDHIFSNSCYCLGCVLSMMVMVGNYNLVYCLLFGIFSMVCLAVLWSLWLIYVVVLIAYFTLFGTFLIIILIIF